jgi:hypothetical protein
MKSISLNDYFNKKNRWTLRLLGLENFQMERKEEKVEAEYNLDKYKKLLERGFTDIELAKQSEWADYGLTQNDPFFISFGDEIFETSVQQSRNTFHDLLTHTIREHAQGKNLCELGCGYGFNLSFFKNEFSTYGGDYSENAAILGRQCGMDVVQFNYYKDSDYDLIRPDSTVFTCHSLEQIPDATSVIESLRKRQSAVNRVIHLEPTVLQSRENLFGMMRNRYMELNDYNRNLYQLLHDAKDINVIAYKQDIFGLNPLNSSNLFVWEFK